MGRFKTHYDRALKKSAQREAYKKQIHEISQMTSREEQEAKIQKLRDQVNMRRPQIRQKIG